MESAILRNYQVTVFSTKKYNTFLFFQKKKNNSLFFFENEFNSQSDVWILCENEIICFATRILCFYIVDF